MRFFLIVLVVNLYNAKCFTCSFSNCLSTHRCSGLLLAGPSYLWMRITLSMLSCTASLVVYYTAFDFISSYLN